MQRLLQHPSRHDGRSVLASLRSLVPDRPLLFAEALQIAELQAGRLRDLIGLADDAMPEQAIAELSRIRLVRRRLPTSGMSYWDGQSWVIAINDGEPEARQRFTIFHEYKHIVDHGRTSLLYRDGYGHSAAERAEQAADYFAGCVLMPKRLMKRAWGERIQTLPRLAALFEVSPRAVEVRLAQIGLSTPRDRCSPPDRLHLSPRSARLPTRRRRT
ncbi:MAG TPA: ImmA/IrrE family metallo-endopeptidase [Mycobacteriales bacterium]|nr:ImmA/IrrE family metallo-endopeptidase [Mycobacteriales bacterium]